MARGIIGNEIPDEAISISVEDYRDYISLLKGRQVILDTIERDNSISVLELLSALGGCKGASMYASIRRNMIRGKRSDEVEQD